MSQGIEEHKDLESAVSQAVSEEGSVRETASEELPRCRNRVRTIEGRLRSLLKGMSGEPSEQVGAQPSAPLPPCC